MNLTHQLTAHIPYRRRLRDGRKLTHLTANHLPIPIHAPPAHTHADTLCGIIHTATITRNWLTIHGHLDPDLLNHYITNALTHHWYTEPDLTNITARYHPRRWRPDTLNITGDLAAITLATTSPYPRTEPATIAPRTTQ